MPTERNIYLEPNTKQRDGFIPSRIHNITGMELLPGTWVQAESFNGKLYKVCYHDADLQTLDINTCLVTWALLDLS